MMFLIFSRWTRPKPDCSYSVAFCCCPIGFTIVFSRILNQLKGGCPKEICPFHLVSAAPLSTDGRFCLPKRGNSLFTFFLRIICQLKVFLVSPEKHANGRFDRAILLPTWKPSISTSHPQIAKQLPHSSSMIKKNASGFKAPTKKIPFQIMFVPWVALPATVVSKRSP